MIFAQNDGDCKQCMNQNNMRGTNLQALISLSERTGADTLAGCIGSALYDQADGSCAVHIKRATAPDTAPLMGNSATHSLHLHRTLQMTRGRHVTDGMQRLHSSVLEKLLHAPFCETTIREETLWSGHHLSSS